MTPRTKIVDDFARWTALSALRAGAGHPKSRSDVYSAFEAVDFGRLFDGTPVNAALFSAWHEESVRRLKRRRFSVGWAAKLINVYLKTRVYVGGDRPAGLSSLIHPPIDAGLWRGLKQRPYYAEIRDLLHPREGTKTVETINGITRYGSYAKIIEGCRAVARCEKCLLIEVEQFWLQDPGSPNYRLRATND